ncbi:hypothetical protein Tco_0087210 [Tanacetum coccineum]
MAERWGGRELDGGGVEEEMGIGRAGTWGRAEEVGVVGEVGGGVWGMAGERSDRSQGRRMEMMMDGGEEGLGGRGGEDDVLRAGRGVRWGEGGAQEMGEEEEAGGGWGERGKDGWGRLWRMGERRVRGGGWEGDGGGGTEGGRVREERGEGIGGRRSADGR